MILIIGGGLILASILIAVFSVAFWLDGIHTEVERLTDRVNRHERAITTGRHIHWEDNDGD